MNLRRSLIGAETASSDGGNITLQVQDWLLLQDNSLISTTAGTALAGGDGGDIVINAPNGFVIAVPEENNDIAANAFEGDGGSVLITAQGNFGLEFREQRTPLSDITASSEFGVIGDVNLNSPDTGFLENSLTEQPDTLLGTEQVVAGSCIAHRNTTNGSLVVTGAGGLTLRPDDASPAEFTAIQVESLPSEVAQAVETIWQPGDPIIEPNSVIALENGKRFLSQGCR